MRSKLKDIVTNVKYYIYFKNILKWFSMIHLYKISTETHLKYNITNIRHIYDNIMM